MDNSWQMKCSSTWQSLMPSMASSSQVQPQEPRNQAWNAGHYFSPRVTQELSSAAREMIQEAMVPKTSNLCVSNSGHADPGSSFLSLLSGPQSLLQCDLQQFSSPNPFVTSSKVPVNSNSFAVDAAGSGVSLALLGVSSQNLRNQNPKIGADLCPVVSSRAVGNANYGSSFSLLDVLQAANLNHQSSEPTKAVIGHSNVGNEKVRDFSSLSAGWLSSRSPANAGKPHSTSTQASQKAPLETNSSISRCSSTLASGGPRVFCLGASGDLLLSNTGLLGVVCSCHGVHMSISKFSEHSGLCAVNPGVAVRMDSGETIAQWRKLYFNKFGIRVPEDHNGWDWPEGFSTTAGTVKRSVTASNMSKNSDLSNLAGFSGGLVGFGQPQNHVAFLRNTDTGQKLVNEVSYDGKQRNAQDSCNFLHKGLIGASQSNLPSMTNNQIMACPLSGCLTMSKFVGIRTPDNGCHSVPAYTDSTSKTGQSFFSHQNFHNSKSSGNDSDVSGFYNLKGNIMDRDAVSSSIELRLGQPSPQSQTLGSSALPAFGSHLLERHGGPQESLLPEQLIYNSNSRAMEEHSQYLQHAAGSSNSYARRGQSQLNLMNHAPGMNNARDAAMMEQLKGDADRSLVISMLLSQFKTPTAGGMHSKATGGVVDGCHVIPKTLHCESHIAKYDPTNSLWSKGNASETQQNINKLGLQNHLDKGKEVAFAADGLHIATEPNFEFHTKHMESSPNCNGAGGTGRHSCLVVHDESSQPYPFSGMPPDACDARNPFNRSGKIPCLGLNGHLDHVFLRSTSLPMDSGPMLPLQNVSMGSSEITSTSISNMTPVLTNKEGSGVSPYLLDDNMRVLAFRQLIKLSNQGHANASLGTNQDQGRLNSSCGEKIQGCTANRLSSKVRRNGLATCKQVPSEVAMKPSQSGFTPWMGGDAENLVPAAGLNKWCSFSTFSPGTSLHSKNIETQRALSCDPRANEQPSVRSGRIENDITPSNEHGKCCQRVPYTYFPGNCGCTVHTSCLEGNCNSKGGTFVSASKELTGSLNGVASMFLAPQFKGNSTFSKEKAISIEKSGNLEGQVKKNVDCHAFQWRDVTSNVTGICNLTCIDRPADLLDRRENVGDQVAAAAKCFGRSAQGAESSKEQEMSNISSGCSAAAVTQESVEFNNLDSSTVGDGVKYTQNHAVDEGSGIDKCWSSDDPPDSERSSEFFGFTCKINSTNEGSSKPLPNRPSRSLIDELRLRDSLILKNVRNQAHTAVSILEKTNHAQEIESGFKSAKRKRPTKWKMLDSSFPDSGIGSAHWQSCPAKDMQMRLQPDKGRSHNCACSVGSSFKQRSVLCLTKTCSRKRDMHRLSNEQEEENDQMQSKDEDDCLEITENSGRKRVRSGQTSPTIKQLRMQESNCADAGINAKSDSADCRITYSTEWVGICNRNVRPVVCGKFGVIANGDSSRPAKIVTLRKIFKAARRYTLAENDQLKATFAKNSRKRSFRGSNGCIDKLSNFKERNSEGHDDTRSSELDPDYSVKETETAYFPGGKEHDVVPSTMEKERDDGSEKDHSILDSCLSTRLKPKFKEIRKRSLNELSIKASGKDSSCVDVSAIKTSKCFPQTKGRYLAKLLDNAKDGKYHAGGICSAKSSEEHQCQSSISHLDAFCCVCGSSNNDEINCLLECGRCLIRVHQACYGVSKVPRGRWYCRPCRASSKNIVCVLCGYGGGAMTRALRSRTIVKSLLKAWNIVTESGPMDTLSPSEVLEDRFSMLSSSTSGLEIDSFPVIRPVPMEPSSAFVWKMDLQKQLGCVKNAACSSSNLKVHNNITAGILDSTVKQWVHMVCGLWTPGTRCPNVDTMSAFDVSGASRPKANVVCSMCNRPGGSCIQCRVRDCFVEFHPWCAHQKGLLQSEVEGVDNENVGFYGRCVLHAAYHQCDSDGDPIGAQTDHPREKEYTCARTEGYKGRKREGFRHNLPCQSKGSGGCVVPQEQLNAWLHINRQKSRPKGLPKLPISDVEYDCRKEYARYKQLNCWKNLVVYKSGIHALGLYTSQFISRGAMVVEYVGEIVGLRVADKRESDYQSGRKLQYKSACYFFRIDKEHIIDATRKGGIARFVNHSCLPNCVAKVISVRNEKKVVFFAERDIYPGEEITYDYHFNHEDEGKKNSMFL